MDGKYVVALPYAKAVFAVASAKKKLPQWSNVLHMLALIASDSRAKRFLTDPRIDWQNRANLFIDVCDTCKGDPMWPPALDQEAKNFVNILAENDRLLITPDVANVYEKLWAEHKGIVKAEVISAVAMSVKQKEKLQRTLYKKLTQLGEVSEPPILEYKLDKSLLGGLIIRIGDRVIDGSIRSRLNKLKEYLLS